MGSRQVGLRGHSGGPVAGMSCLPNFAAQLAGRARGTEGGALAMATPGQVAGPTQLSCGHWAGLFIRGSLERLGFRKGTVSKSQDLLGIGPLQPPAGAKAGGVPAVPGAGASGTCGQDLRVFLGPRNWTVITSSGGISFIHSSCPVAPLPGTWLSLSSARLTWVCAQARSGLHLPG